MPINKLQHVSCLNKGVIMTYINTHLDKVIERMKLLQSGASPEEILNNTSSFSVNTNYGDGFSVNALRDKIQNVNTDIFQRMENIKEEQKEDRKEPFFKRLFNKLETFFKNIIDFFRNPNKTKEPDETSETEKFEDVFAEMSENVPDSTSTIEEKELALEYINRMLACEDIPNADYWQNKKDIITMEIQTIKNESQIGQDSDWQAVAEEWGQFTDEFWNKEPKFDNVPDRVEYYKSYYQMYISFCDRVLAFDNLPEDVRTEWTRMKANAQRDLDNHLADLENYNKENEKISVTTEKFEEVFAEMQANIPDSTTTVEEKQSALEYINRMLACEDIPNAKYWENKKNIIEMEIQSIENSQVEPNKEKVKDVWEEFTKFINKHFGSIDDTMSMDEKFENRQAYYNTYKTFIYRLKHCVDITDVQRAEYSRMEFGADEDMSNWERDYQLYKDEN